MHIEEYPDNIYNQNVAGQTTSLILVVPNTNTSQMMAHTLVSYQNMIYIPQAGVALQELYWHGKE